MSNPAQLKQSMRYQKWFTVYELNDKYPEEIKAILKDEECLLYYSKLIDEEKDISFLALNGVIVEAFKKRND